MSQIVRIICLWFVWFLHVCFCGCVRFFLTQCSSLYNCQYLVNPYNDIGQTSIVVHRRGTLILPYWLGSSSSLFPPSSFLCFSLSLSLFFPPFLYFLHPPSPTLSLSLIPSSLLFHPSISSLFLHFSLSLYFCSFPFVFFHSLFSLCLSCSSVSLFALPSSLLGLILYQCRLSAQWCERGD